MRPKKGVLLASTQCIKTVFCQISRISLAQARAVASPCGMTDSGTPPCIVALDYADSESMFQFLDQVSPDHPVVKIGLQMFCSYGPQSSRSRERGYNIFLDLKLHDIPNTVAGAIKAFRKPTHQNAHHPCLWRSRNDAACSRSSAGICPKLKILSCHRFDFS